MARSRMSTLKTIFNKVGKPKRLNSPQPRCWNKKEKPIKAAGNSNRRAIESIRTRPRFVNHRVIFDVMRGRRGAKISQRNMTHRIPKKNANRINSSLFLPIRSISKPHFVCDNHFHKTLPAYPATCQGNRELVRPNF